MTLSKKKLFEKFMALQQNESGNIGTLVMVFMAVIIVIAIVIAFQFAPSIGYSVEQTNTIPAGSQWNATTNPSMVTGSEIWTTQSGTLSAVVTIGIIVIALAALFGMFAVGRITGGKGGGM